MHASTGRPGTVALGRGESGRDELRSKTVGPLKRERQRGGRAGNRPGACALPRAVSWSARRLERDARWRVRRSACLQSESACFSQSRSWRARPLGRSRPYIGIRFVGPWMPSLHGACVGGWASVAPSRAASCLASLTTCTKMPTTCRATQTACSDRAASCGREWQILEPMAMNRPGAIGYSPSDRARQLLTGRGRDVRPQAEAGVEQAVLCAAVG
jgi:hypothetical protein